MALLYKHLTIISSKATSWYITQLSQILRLFSAGVLRFGTAQRLRGPEASDVAIAA
jgi:hypothetical protein